jgi:Flp pilus assembly protein TadD
VPTLRRLRSALLFPFRSRRRAVAGVAALAALGFAAWYGVRLYLFHRDIGAAREALAQYDFTAAREGLRDCLAFRPRHPEALLLAARAARRDGALDEARAHLTRYYELEGLTAEWRLESRLQRVAEGRVEEDVEYLTTLVDTGEPATAEQILEALAEGSVTSYQFELQRFWVGTLLNHFPKNPVGRLILAQNYVIGGRHDRAAEQCRAILADYPRFVRARLYLAGVLYRSQKYEEGAAVYAELRRSRPDDPEVTLGLARCLDRSGRTEEARPLVRELEDRHADNSEALLECGRFALKDGRPDDAERLLTRAVALAPNDPEVRFQLSACLERLGRTEESRLHLAEFKRIEADLRRMEQLQAEIAKAPNNPAPRREMGLICLRNGQDQEALRWLYGVLDTHPNDRATHEALANHFQARGDTDRAFYHRSRAR